MIRGKVRVACGLALMTVAACSVLTPPEERRRQAEAALQRGVESHQRSAEADLPAIDREALLRQATRHYRTVLNDYADETALCAKAQLNLGNVRAAQGRLDEAIACYTQVGRRYPDEDWEVFQAWKTAGDLLWDAGRKDEARAFYKRMVDRWPESGGSEVISQAVRAAARRVAIEPSP
jgi:tetratricopeptide (TPR) repeat protein